jgi:hypothetical protein
MLQFATNLGEPSNWASSAKPWLAGRGDWILSTTGIRFTTDHQDQEKDALISDLQQKVTNLQQQVAEFCSEADDRRKQTALQTCCVAIGRVGCSS